LRIAPWGTGDSGRGSLSEPVALALDGHGDLWVLDADTLFSGLRTPSLLEYSPAGRLIKQGRLQLATVSDPLIGGIALDGRGHIEVTQDAGQRETRADINVYSASLLSSTYVNRPVSTFSMYGSRRSQYRGGSASGITHDRLGDTYIADAYNNRISVLSPSGAWLFAVGRHGASARGIAVDSHGNVYVADPINNRVQRLVPRKRTR
jgi:hypothetical protein